MTALATLNPIKMYQRNHKLFNCDSIFDLVFPRLKSFYFLFFAIDRLNISIIMAYGLFYFVCLFFFRSEWIRRVRETIERNQTELCNKCYCNENVDAYGNGNSGSRICESIRELIFQRKMTRTLIASCGKTMYEKTNKLRSVICWFCL